MLNQHAPDGARERTVDVNSLISLVNAALLTIVGNQLLLVAPGVVQGLVSYRGFSDVQAGYIASAEMTGLAVAAIAFSLVSHKADWRLAARAFLSLAILGNLFSIFAEGYGSLLVSRFICGAGSGGVVAICYAVVGLTRHPERNFGLLFAAAMVYAAIVLYFMPAIYQAIGFRSIFVFFAVMAFAPLLVAHVLPSSGDKGGGPAQSVADASDWRYKAAALFSLFVFFIAVTGSWAYVSIIGVNRGLSESSAANGLMLAQFGGIAGGLCAGLLVDKLGRSLAAALTYLAIIIPILLLLRAFNAGVFAILLIVLTFGWAAAQPILLGVAAKLDSNGRVMFFAVALQSIGLAIGPAAAAFVLSIGTYNQMLVTCAGILLLSLASVLFAFVHVNRLTVDFAMRTVRLP